MPGVMVRLPSEMLARLDAWIAQQPMPHPTRPETMRRALEAVIRLGGLDPLPAPKAAARKKAGNGEAVTRTAPAGGSRYTSGMEDDQEAVLQHMRDQLAAHEREAAAVLAVTAMLLDRGWEALERGHALLAWFGRDSG